MFSIKSLTIYPHCAHRKNLEVGTYDFGECPYHDFYGENISLHVIVGKNGSGKSSILDMILRMANNVGALMLKSEDRVAAADLNFVRGIHADLVYAIPGDNDSIGCRLCIRDKAVWIESEAKAFWMSAPELLGHEYTEDDYYKSCVARFRGVENVPLYIHTRTLQQQEMIAQHFFYTVATNYSMLGFLSPDYDEEESIYYTFEKQFNEAGAEIRNQEGQLVGEFKWRKSTNWINSLFHKNDGYMCPIVLNPYRDDAKIDMENETNLTVQRLAALLICEDDDAPLLDNYRLDHIDYELSDNFITKFKQSRGGKSREQLLADFEDTALDQNSYANSILHNLECPFDRGLPEIFKITALYIVQKSLNIAGTYPSYTRRFDTVGNIDKAFILFEDATDITVTRALAAEIRSHSSHIEQKVQQARNFYIWAYEHRAEIATLGNKFNYEQYRVAKNLPQYQMDRLQECMFELPPAIFRQKIFLKRKSNEGSWNGNIPMSRMSSGEKQLVFQLSTIIYHLHNLLSVSPANLRYSNINLILDEIEVCYHPEYQRDFLDKLLTMLKGQNFHRRMHINIIATTHSPFILSDITSSQLMYLKEGHQLKGLELDNMPNPFAANVNEVLHQSFFLSDGFIGKFARRKILELVQFLNDNLEEEVAMTWSIEQAESLIASIEEPYIKRQLQHMLDEYYAKQHNADRIRAIEALKNERALIQQRIDKLEGRQ